MYKGAFKCSKYEGPNGKPCDCPCWHKLVFTNIQSSETRRVDDCLFRLLPDMMVEVVKASNRPAAAVESVRNVLADGLQQLTPALEALASHRELLDAPRTDKQSSR